MVIELPAIGVTIKIIAAGESEDGVVMVDQQDPS